MTRAHNFSAGPAALPLPALQQAQTELLDFAGSGMSIMEQSHRGKTYDAVHREALDLLRELLAVPDDYDIVFLQGGATLQFAMVAYNFLRSEQRADYLITDVWGEKALSEAAHVGAVREAANTKTDKSFLRVPTQAELSLDPKAAYVHYTSNNTIAGTQFHYRPNVGEVPLICDMSSDFMAEPIDVRDYKLIYAGAQKNLGPSGVTIVVAERKFLESARTDIPAIMRYFTHAKEGSLHHTPPTFAVYLVRNVLAWTKAQGGLLAMQRRNAEKARLLYSAIDDMSDFYRCPIETASRSRMNVVFRLPSDALDERFVNEAKAKGLVGLKGHRITGGIRVSLYNAVEPASVEVLVEFMRRFKEAA